MDMYQNLDVKQKRMPDLLIDQSAMANKRVWIGGKYYDTHLLWGDKLSIDCLLNYRGWEIVLERGQVQSDTT